MLPSLEKSWQKRSSQPHVAGNQPAEVFLDSLALVIEFVHG